MYLKLNFQYPFNISFNNFGKDTLSLEIFENSLILDEENSLVVDPESLGLVEEIDIEPRPPKPEVVKQMKELVTRVSYFIIVL